LEIAPEEVKALLLYESAYIMLITENFATEAMMSLYALLLNAKIVEFRYGI
jgi:hypothetical protein